MTPSSPAGGSDGKVAVGAEVIEQLASALEAMAAAFAIDEVSEAAQASMVRTLAPTRRSGMLADSAPASPEQLRTTRDYDALRGLLGRVDAPRPLAMRRSADNAINVSGELLPSVVVAVVESARGVVERFWFDTVVDGVTVRASGPPYVLPLTVIGRGDPIIRIELLDGGDALVAFGPNLPALL